MGNLLYDPIISALLVVLIIGILIYRQIRPRKISRSGLFIFPLIVLYFIIQSIPTFHPTLLKIVEISISSIISAAFGLFACRELRVYKGASGKAMAKGSWTYFLWWVGAFIVKSLLSVLFGETSFSGVNQLEIMLPVFFLISTRSAYMYWKTAQLGLELH